MKTFDQFLQESAHRMDVGVMHLEKAFPREQAIKHGVAHMSNHLQAKHGFPKANADAAAKNHHEMQTMLHAHSGPEHVSRDSSD